MTFIGNNITTQTRDILNSGADDARKMGKLSDQAQNALAKVSEGAKYDSRAELDKTGAGARHDAARSIRLNAEAYKSTKLITAGKLSIQQQAVDSIGKVLTNFKAGLSQSNSVTGSNADKANKALDEIQHILRSRTPSGEYIFGGNDPFNDPLSIVDQSGKRISVDLTQQSNIKNGTIAENNYSTTSADESVVGVSSAHQVRQNFLHPGMDSIVKAIGFLNIVKTGEVAAAPNVPAVTLDDIANAQIAQEQSLGKTFILIDTEVEKLSKAEEVNGADIVRSNGALEEFKGDLVETLRVAYGSMQSLMASAHISKTRDNLFRELAQAMR